MKTLAWDLVNDRGFRPYPISIADPRCHDEDNIDYAPRWMDLWTGDYDWRQHGGHWGPLGREEYEFGRDD